jgi:hypothetical protein
MKQQLKLAGVFTVIIVVACFLFLFNPASSGFYPPCPFHKLTGLYCPGCGSLRASHQLLHGNLFSALDLNPLMVLSLPFLGYSLISYSMMNSGRLACRAGRRFPQIFLPPILIWMILGVILAFWVLRNIPAYPFSVLAP